MKKLFSLICIVALILPVVTQANNGADHAHKGPNAAVRKYIKEQVLPVLIQKRQQFDHELNVSEKTEIADCRAALKKLHGERHEWKKPEQGNGQADNTYYGQQHNYNAQYHQPNPEFEQRKAIMQRLQVIANNHSNSLDDIKNQLEPARKQWVNDIKNLQQAANSNNTNEKTTEGTHQDWHHKGGVEGFLYPHHLAARFLLLPTSAANSDDADGVLKSDAVNPSSNTNEGLTVPATTSLTEFTLMPNPASNDLQLGNDALPASNILKVIDLQGKEVMSVENVQPAQHLDISQLANGTYVVEIRSGDQTITKKVVVSK